MTLWDGLLRTGVTKSECSSSERGAPVLHRMPGGDLPRETGHTTVPWHWWYSLAQRMFLPWASRWDIWAARCGECLTLQHLRECATTITGRAQCSAFFWYFWDYNTWSHHFSLSLLPSKPSYISFLVSSKSRGFSFHRLSLSTYMNMYIHKYF